MLLVQVLKFKEKYNKKSKSMLENQIAFKC